MKVPVYLSCAKGEKKEMSLCPHLGQNERVQRSRRGPYRVAETTKGGEPGVDSGSGRAGPLGQLLDSSEMSLVKRKLRSIVFPMTNGFGVHFQANPDFENEKIITVLGKIYY